MTEPQQKEEELDSVSPVENPDSQDGVNDDFFSKVLEMVDEDIKTVDDRDYAFLTDFTLVNVTYTVYEQLQQNSFFLQKDHPEIDPELQAFQTKGRFRLCQLYPVVLRATIGYFHHIGKSYYDSTIKTRRTDQVPLGLTPKAYSVVCQAVRRLVLTLIEKESEKKKDEPLPSVVEEDSSLLNLEEND